MLGKKKPLVLKKAFFGIEIADEAIYKLSDLI